jgi:hypothetical protein
MKRIHLVAVAVVTAAALQACANLEDTGTSTGVGLSKEEASIPFANQRSAVHSWQADGREGLWVQDARREWYYAKFIGPCHGLDHAISLGFDTGTSDRIDRFSHVIVPDERERCAIISFTRSEPPPDGKRRSLAGEEVK